jgi:hypothetical protein
VRKSILVALVAALVGLTAATARAGTTFTVTNTNDSGPGSLRQAILDANASPGKDTIAFDIPGAGIHVIEPLTDLPVVVDPVSINGATQPGYHFPSGPPAIQLLGDQDPASQNSHGLIVDASSSDIRALAIGGFDEGILLGPFGGNDKVRGCVIGADPDGVVATPNGVGIQINDDANTIGGHSFGTRNVISGNSVVGVVIEIGNSNVVEGNTIGTTSDGQRPLPNGIGVAIDGPSQNNSIGGPGLGANVISGNANDGILLQPNSLLHPGQPLGGSPSHTAIQHNLIGTNAQGTAGLGNGWAGIELFGSSQNIIGGSLLTNSGNVISGNSLYGIHISGGAANQISSNLIGTSLDGMHRIGNSEGIRIEDGSSGNLIGRLTLPHAVVGGANVISGNSDEAVIEDVGTGNQILGNVIGLAGDGVTPLPNLGPGLYLVNESGMTVGSEKDPNTIAHNEFSGVQIGGDDANVRISANSIFDNGGFPSSPDLIGIDLNLDGVTSNDPGDSDTGPNGLQNFPVVTSVTRQGGQVTIGGTLNSRPFGTYRLEFFTNSSCDPSGYGQGQTYLGEKTVVADASGNVSFSAKFPLNPSSATPIVTATATDGSGNTSEFSACSSSG